MQNYEAQLGFTGIAVAFLGQNNPIGIVFAAILWAILSRGETALQIETDVPREFVIILQGILIFCVVVVYQIAKRRLARRELQRAGAEVGLRDTAEPELEDETAAGGPDGSHRHRRVDPDRVHLLHDPLPHRARRPVQRALRAS